MMKIAVRDIPRDGLEFDEHVKPEEIGLEPKDLDCQSALHIHTTVERVDNTVLVKSAVRATYGLFCARCLESLRREKTHQFQFDYQIEPGLEMIDLAEDIRQEIIISVEQRILCRDNCQGICLGCGVNLNKEKCKCQ